MIKTNTNAIVNEELLHEEVPFKLEVKNITQLTKAELDQLKAGDVVVKVTGKQRHSYRVSYKGEGAGQGICLTYSDASVVETVSYDRSGDDWVYNSTDVMPLVNVEDASSGKVQDILGLDANGDLVKGTISSGTIQDVLGLDASGDLVKGQAGGGTQLYKHEIRISISSGGNTLTGSYIIETTDAEQYKATPSPTPQLYFLSHLTFPRYVYFAFAQYHAGLLLFCFSGSIKAIAIDSTVTDYTNGQIYSLTLTFISDTVTQL